MAKNFKLEKSDLVNCCFVFENKSYIFLDLTGIIEDISTTLHEFAHYLCNIYSNNTNFSNTLKEYMSIFYELYSLYYLYKNGYSLNEIKTINEFRTSNTHRINIYCDTIFSYISMLLENKEIKEEQDVENQKGFVNYLKSSLPVELIKNIE